MNKLKTYLLLLVIITMVNGCLLPKEKRDEYNTWAKSWPGKYPGFVYHGYIITFNGDTLRGILNIWKSGKPATILSSIALLPDGKTSQENIISINLNSFRCVRLFNKYAPTGYSDYINILNKRWKGIWLLIKQKGNVAIYNMSAYAMGYIDYKKKYHGTIILAKKDSIIRIQGSWGTGIQGSKRHFLNFINKRYNQHFKLKDFKTEDAMVDYILDKENEKISK